MEENKPGYSTIDEYIALYPPEVQEKLQAIRKVIRESAPDATEKISWRMPTFYMNGNLIHFAAFKNHIGLYPGASGIANFEYRFTEYKSSKGAVQFPMNKPLPFELITEIVRFCVADKIKEAAIKAKAKRNKK